MFSLFKKNDVNKIKCKFCDKAVDKSASIVIQYKATDGIGSMDVCMVCANELNNIMDMSTNYESK